MSLGSSVSLATERIIEPVEGMHRAIAGGWFNALGAIARPVRLAHEAISSLVYGSIRLAGTAVGFGLEARAAVAPRRVDAVQAFVNGLWGDGLGRHEIRLATSMSVRDRTGTVVPVDGDPADWFPSATGRLVVLVHGLMKTERCWEGTATSPGLMQALEEHPALTTVAVRYNTGLPVADNGAQLASLLEKLVSNWPVPVTSIALVGHSMGGLVVRSARAEARLAGNRWVDYVHNVVTIGAPHGGAPLEKFVHVAEWGLNLAPPTRPLAGFLNRRSEGIKDLRSGIPDDDPWAADARPDVNHHFVAGVITSNPAHPLGAIVGDLMVRPASGTRVRRLDPANVVVLGGVHHFDLIHERAVIDCVMGWLEPPV